MFRKKTIRDVDVRNRRVLVRVDFNVPLKDGRVADDSRIRAALPTLRYLLERGATLFLVSHLGRPKGQRKPELSLAPVAPVLERLLGHPVTFLPDCIGPVVAEAAAQAQPGQVFLLENVRFYPGETKNDPEFARQLAEPAEIFVNDAFGTAHRAHASTVGVTRYLPAVAGFLLEQEVRILTEALESPRRPLVALLGGAKISDKIKLVENLARRADALLIGGGMANTFLAAQGLEMADSLVEADALDEARRLLEAYGDKIRLPSDLLVAEALDANAATQVIALPEPVPPGWKAVDIGPGTIEAFGAQVREAGTVLWNGPMGVFEIESFARGTFALAWILADSPAQSIVGGGDTAAAVRMAGVADRMTHVSTGGGASLKLLAGEPLPAVEALDDKE